jgi:hypothetical protein
MCIAMTLCLNAYRVRSAWLRLEQTWTRAMGKTHHCTVLCSTRTKAWCDYYSNRYYTFFNWCVHTFPLKKKFKYCSAFNPYLLALYEILTRQVKIIYMFCLSFAESARCSDRTKTEPSTRIPRNHRPSAVPHWTG